MSDNNDHKQKALDALKNVQFDGSAPITHALLYIGDMIRRDTDLENLKGE